MKGFVDPQMSPTSSAATAVLWSGSSMRQAGMVGGALTAGSVGLIMTRAKFVSVLRATSWLMRVT